MNPDGGLRVAYPTDRQGREPTSLLVGAGLADRRGSTLLPVPGSVIKRLVAVDGADLPALLLDGVFDAVFTTSDRLLEGRIDEAARGRSRPLGRVVELTGPDAPAVAPLVWGFLASTAPSADLWEDGLFDLARGGLDFSPGHGAPRTVLCATTHPATARSILDRLEIATDVRCYPDPWSVVTNSRSYCGLALASPVDLASRSLVLDESAPVADESPLLAFNRVAWASAARHPLLQRLENVVRRFLVGRSATRIELFGPVEAIEAGLADTPGVRYVRAHAVDQRGEARIEVVVDAARVQSVMETLADLGAQRMVSGRLLLADVRGRDGA